MGLVLCNSYPKTIWTSIVFYSPRSCGGDGGAPFERMGWWGIAPGSCTLVYANDLADVNQFWYYYAEAEDGAVWSGPFFSTVSLEAFGGDQWCWNRERSAGNDHLVGVAYRQLDIGDNDDYTLTFVP